MKRINWGLILVFLLLLGGLSSLTVYLTTTIALDVALAIALLFAALGAVALGFFMMDGRGWRFVTMISWVAAAIALAVYVILSGWVDVALAIAILFFIAASIVVYLLYLRQGEPSPAERDVPPGR